jgi:DNA replication protein DnaC
VSYTEIKIGDRVFKMKSGIPLQEPEQIREYDIPTEYKSKTFDNFITNKENYQMVESLKNFSLKFKEYKDLSFYISGTTGTGKTMLSCCVYKNVFDSGYKCLFININDMFEHVKQSYNPRNSSEANFENKLRMVDLLILDDIGSNQMNDWTYQIIYNVVNSRYENKKSTIFTSNCTLNNLYEYIDDERIISRIAGMCKNRIYNLTGNDWRVRNG